MGLVRLIPGTGSTKLRNEGIIDSVGSTEPTFYFGKGLGDLPAAYLRPIAITGEVSRQFSDTPSASPSAWNYAVSLQYSIPYLQQNVKALHASQFLTRMTPIVEFAMSTRTLVRRRGRSPPAYSTMPIPGSWAPRRSYRLTELRGKGKVPAS